MYNLLIVIAVKTLTLFSQFLHVILTAGAAHEDEMLSSAAYRQKDKKYWKEIHWILDNFSPVMFWHDPGKGHCESCFDAEKLRVKDHYETLHDHQKTNNQ